MKVSTFIIVLLASLSMSSISVAADDPIASAIKARIAHMDMYGFNIGIVAAMAKGKTEYDAKAASDAADNLLALANIKGGAMWPQGSSQSDPGLADKTRAKSEIWTTYPKVVERNKDMVKAAEKFAGLAGQDLKSLRAGIKDLGAACKGCHKEFRAKKQ